MTKDTIPMRDVVSGHVSKLGHKDNTLYVEFKGGSRYSYANVPASVYEGAFKDGVSPGKWLDSQIKGNYPFTKLGKATS